MRLRPSLRVFAIAIMCAASHAPWAADPVAGRDYYSVQLRSAASAAALQPALASLRDQPYARIDKRGDAYALRIGRWQDRAAAERAAQALRGSFPSAYARIAAYTPDVSATDGGARLRIAKTPAPGRTAAAAEYAAQANVLAQRHAEQANVIPNPAIPGNVPATGVALPERQAARAPPRARGAAAPDEAPLWALQREERYAELAAELARLRNTYPGWSPPPDLVALQQEGEANARITQSISAQDWHELKALAQRYPQFFDCDHVNFMWSLADAYHALDDAAQTAAVYQRIVPACSRAADRIATLYQARDRLTPEEYAALLQREAQAGSRDPAAQAAVEQIVYEQRLAQFLQAVKAKELPRALGLIDGFEVALRARRDARNAALVGWVYFDSGQPESAAAWFDTALGWEPTLDDARYGVALANFRMQRLSAAEAALLKADPDDVRNRALRGDILFARALAAYDAKDYRQSQVYLNEAQTHGKSGRDAAMLGAWNDYQLGNDEPAARRFIAAYRAQPDSPSADGAVLSLTRAGRWDELDALALSLGGAFGTRAQSARGQRYYDRKLFLAAEDAAPGYFAQLRNIATPTLALGAAVRDKSGEDGTSRLRLTKAPFFEGTLGFRGTDELRLQLYRVELDSGALPPNAMIGSYPAAGAFVTAPTTRLNHGFEPHLSYRHEGWLTTYAGLGMTPGGAVLASAPVGNLGVMQQTVRGNWRAEVFVEPVRESILSYTGIVDPYTGQNWGRVRRSGALAGGYAGLGDRWGASGQLRLVNLEGEQVAGNQGLTLNLGLAKDLGLRGFDYFSIGPDLTYDAYRRNLSHFTLGHGGYFSPESLLSAGVSAHFLTAEARQYILKGDGSVGVFNKREAASPCFPLGAPVPLNPGCQNGYGAASASGIYYTAELMGVRRLSDHVQIGGGVILRRNPQYQDKAALVFVRYVFGARPAVMSSDLPTGLIRSLY